MLSWIPGSDADCSRDMTLFVKLSPGGALFPTIIVRDSHGIGPSGDVSASLAAEAQPSLCCVGGGGRHNLSPFSRLRKHLWEDIGCSPKAVKSGPDSFEWTKRDFW